MTNFEPQEASILSRADRIRELSKAVDVLLAEQEKQIPISRRQDDEIKRKTNAALPIIKEMDTHSRELKKEAERTDRFYREYWRLLLLIAQKANLIDDEDVKKLQAESW